MPISEAEAIFDNLQPTWDLPVRYLFPAEEISYAAEMALLDHVSAGEKRTIISEGSPGAITCECKGGGVPHIEIRWAIAEEVAELIFGDDDEYLDERYDDVVEFLHPSQREVD
jgi:hypothetical protein